MKINTFIYYGVLFNKEDYENLTSKLNIGDLYSRVFGVGLRFREVGDISDSWQYVIGKEIHWDINNNIDLEFKNEGFIIKDKNIKLKIEDESDVRKRLLQIGISNIPTYKIFSCWDKQA